MNAATSKPEPLLIRFVEAIAKFRPSRMMRVPEGYQDEHGFHYGLQPVENKKITWPPTE